MGGTSRTSVVTPEILIDGVGGKGLSQRLQTVVIHALDDRANARIKVSGHVRDVFARGYTFRTTEVAVRMNGQDAFSGVVDEVGLRAPEGGPTLLLLVASGTAHAATTRRTVPVRYGNELTALSVRRRAGRTRARGVLTSVTIRCGARLEVVTPDPEFDGVFTVVELWHRYDTAQGARTEFIAEA